MKRILKITFISLGIIVLSIITLIGGYVGFLLISYNRIGDMEIEVTRKSSIEMVDFSESYRVATYNIGFGAYSQDFTFFLDTGYDVDGNETCGYHSTARSEEEVLFNINGSISTLKNLDLDFILLQEVDIDSTRAHHVDQNAMFEKEFSDYDNSFAINFDSEFLPYPLYDMHGKSLSGLSTFSNIQIQESHRKEYTIKDDISKFFDLDRCFSVSRLAVNNEKSLYFINSHMSAYDEGGIMKKEQVKELNAVLKTLKDNGDYVIVGGDFNHDLITNNPDFNYSSENKPFNNVLKDPDWVTNYFDEEGNSPVVDGYKVVVADNVPTCRNNDVAWGSEYIYTVVVDGFIVSSNIEVLDICNVETKQGNLKVDGFAFSDHQPSVLEFKLL